MDTIIQKWGNSQGLRITREILAEAGIKTGSKVTVSAQKDAILISKAKGTKPSLRELLAKVPKDYRVEEFDWGQLKGKEVW